MIKYDGMELEIIYFASEDVITASCTGDGCGIFNPICTGD